MWWGGDGEVLKKVVYREAQSRGSYLFILHFIKRRYFFRAELLLIDHYRKYPPPPGNTKNCQRVPPLLVVP